MLRWMLGPYKDRKAWLQLTGKTYISPSAQFSKGRIIIGKQCFLDDHVTLAIHGEDGAINLEDRVSIWRGSIMEVGKGGTVSVGSGTAIQPYCVLNAFVGSLWIGRNVQIAAHSMFFPYGHRIEDHGRLIKDGGLASKGGIVIEDDVWIGAGATVTDGVRVGRGSVVGAGSVVTKNVPSYSVVAGVPARVISTRKKEL